jgi:hypothetical protein
MRCPAIPEPTGPDLESLSTWGFDLAQRYEICAARHNACAERITLHANEETDHE